MARKNSTAPGLHRLTACSSSAKIFDVDPKEAVNRINSASDEKRQDSDKFRELEFITGLRKLFNDLPKKLLGENIAIIDANKPIDEVFLQVKEQIDKVLH